MTRWFLMAVVASVALALGMVVAPCGCVVAYDPSAPPRFGVAPSETPASTQAAAPSQSTTTKGTQVATAPPAPPAPPATAPPAARAPARPALPTVPAPDTPAGRQLAWVNQVLSGQTFKGFEKHFSPSFLQRVSPAEFRKTVQQWRRDEFGEGPAELAQVTETSPSALGALMRGQSTDRYTQVRLETDQLGRISTLLLAPVIGVKLGEITTWDAFDASAGALPGSFVMAAYQLSDAQPGQSGQPREVHTLGADRRLAIGSVSKLYILGALAEQIVTGGAKWDDIVVIQDALKSLPTGRLQLEPQDTEIPLSGVVEDLISLSDNTAADHLLHRLGRERVEDYLKSHGNKDERNFPFLSTMEFYKLKLTGDHTLAQRYAGADVQTRRDMLATGGPVEQATISADAMLQWKWPYTIDSVEWFATAPECCGLMADLHRLEQQPGMEPLARALRINPGLTFDPRTWKSVGYKGGSEPGVLNMTWLLERSDGRWYVLSLGWNDPAKPLDMPQMIKLAGVAVAILSEEK
jgi:Beta-lactamase enzyme family/ORF 12 gene product N-terminal